MIDDSELLRRYARERSEHAFAELVRRHAGLVCSAALRQVNGDAALAQDVSQSVFIDLARTAGQRATHPNLESWLYTSTRFAALNALREKRRRLAREQKAQIMTDIERGGEFATEGEWEQIGPLLDSALCDLPERDRSAVLLRYFEGLPFAAMGEKLGIGESSARMRSERALNKLRAKLERKGITSTVAALGVVLSTKAIAAPPVGMAATLTSSAITHSLSVGSGVGVLVKLYQISVANKLRSVAVAAIATTATGFASYQTDESARNATFFVYSVCFGVGLLFTLLSALGAHSFGGHAELGHDVHTGHAQGHAEGGSGASDMPGFAPLSPTTIATFITAFGGFGMIFAQFGPTRGPWLSVPLSALSGLCVAVLVFSLFRMIFRKTQASSEGCVAELIGFSATVITPIASGKVGEIAYVQSGTRYSAPARADDGAAFANGATVKITRIVGTQFYVADA